MEMHHPLLNLYILCTMLLRWKKSLHSVLKIGKVEIQSTKEKTRCRSYSRRNHVFVSTPVNAVVLFSKNKQERFVHDLQRVSSKETYARMLAAIIVNRQKIWKPLNAAQKSSKQFAVYDWNPSCDDCPRNSSILHVEWEQAFPVSPPDEVREVKKRRCTFCLKFKKTCLIVHQHHHGQSAICGAETNITKMRGLCCNQIVSADFVTVEV